MQVRKRGVAASVALVGAMILGGASPALADTSAPPEEPITETVTEQAPVETPEETVPELGQETLPAEEGSSEVKNADAPVESAETEEAGPEPKAVETDEPTAAPVKSSEPEEKEADVAEPREGEGDDLPETEPPVTTDPWLRWFPDGSEQPPFWVALDSTPGNPVIDCAVPGAAQVATQSEREAADKQYVQAYDVIQWDVTQSAGTVSFDLAASDCGQTWDISPSVPLAPYIESDAAFLSFNAGVITIDIDEMNQVRGDDGRAVSVKAERADGSVVSVGMNITRPAPPVIEPELPTDTCDLDDRGWPVRWNEEGSTIEQLHGDSIVVPVGGGFGYVSDSLHGRIHSDSTDAWVNLLVPDEDGAWQYDNEQRTFTVAVDDLLATPQFVNAGITALTPRTGSIGDGDSFALTESALTITSNGMSGSFEIAPSVRVQIDPAPTEISIDCAAPPVVDPEPEEPVIDEPDPEEPPVLVEPEPEPEPVADVTPAKKPVAKELAYTGVDGAVAWAALGGVLLLAVGIGLAVRWVPQREKSRE